MINDLTNTTRMINTKKKTIYIFPTFFFITRSENKTRTEAIKHSFEQRLRNVTATFYNVEQ